MIKKILFILFFYINSIFYSYAEIICEGLPGCKSKTENVGQNFIINSIDYFIQIVSVFGVFGVIYAGFLYLTSSGDGEKAKKGVKVVTISLVGVFIAISAWGIVQIINNINIDL